MKAKKYLGQHFLHNPEIAKRIVKSLYHPLSYQYLIEVGPGQGALTSLLTSMVDATLILVEKDPRLIHSLNSNYPYCLIIQDDILKVDLKEIVPANKAGLIGNFPYNISSQIVFKIIDSYPLIIEMVGMFQREMAQRICSVPGSKEYGVISVLTQAKYDATLLFEVGNENFSPVPNVASAVIRLQIKENPHDLHDHPRFKKLIKQSFGMRRKMLKNSLKGYFTPEILENNLLFKQRPEQLSLSDFYTITEISLNLNES